MKLLVLFASLFSFQLHAQKSIYEYVKKETAEYNKGHLVNYFQDVKDSDRKLIGKWVDTGRNIVFSYEQLLDIPDTFDEQIETKFYFEIPDSSKNFQLTLSGSDSLKPPIFYIEYGIAWGGTRLLESAVGTIKGKLAGESWQIDANLELNIIDKRSLQKTKAPMHFSKLFTRTKEKGNKQH